ncbi:MAG: HD domain-containing protein [Clostridiales bacterium]|nr:HD domain-containing protein [Candidatus Blautia equi]
MMDAKKVFLDYASRFDSGNGMIHLKIVHTLEVVKVMDRLTEMMGLDGEMRELAHLCAMFHDIGRFEQVKRYGTFLDHLSEDHATLGCRVLREEKLLNELTKRQQQMLLTAIENHNKYAIEEGLDEETLLLARLIRDADKSDIFRVFACEDMVDTMGETIEEVEQETITDCVYDCIFAHRCVEKTIRRTGLDKWVGFLAFFFDMNFPETMELLQGNSYYRKQFDEAHFTNPETRRKVAEILDEVERYIAERRGQCD